MKALSLVLLSIAALLARDAMAGEYPGRGGWGAKESVFRVRCGISAPEGPRDVDLGTAFGHKSGNVLSANHVIEPCLNANGHLRFAASDGSVSSAAVLIRDAVLDLALLKPDDGFVKNPLAISSDDKFGMGAQVTSWGFPSGYSGEAALLTVGYLAGVVSDPSNPSIRRWVVNAAINKGNSGGPLLETDTPSIIGVVIQKLSPVSPGAASQLKTLSESGSQEVIYVIFFSAVASSRERKRRGNEKSLSGLSPAP
jgi:S1-C subfamily serine protease